MSNDVLSEQPIEQGKAEEKKPSLWAPIRRGATEGPLANLIPVFVDVETFMDEKAGISLTSMTLRQYIKASYLTSIAVAIGDEEPTVLLTDNGRFSPDDAWIIDVLTMLAKDPKYIFVAHNAAFDIRVLRYMLGIPQPCWVWCTVEGAMAAWPELPGGYGLFNLGEGLRFPKDKRKLEIDLDAGGYTLDELKIYNGRDVVVDQELYFRQIARIHPLEQRIALLTHNVRKFHFLVDSEKLDSLIITLDHNARLAENAARDVMMNKDDPDAKYANQDDDIGADGVIILNEAEVCEVFNREDKNSPGVLRSVRGARLINIIREKFGITLPRTSLKKLSPVWQAKHPKITELLRQTTRANKMLSHSRRSKNLQNVPEVDVELGYARAHTMRFSSPAQGKGLNIHNIPKHDVSIAKPVRQIFHLPDDKCFVRGDLSNVEYRVEGWLTDCRAVYKMFDESLGGDRFSDPYINSWKSMTMQSIGKKDPIRQVSKCLAAGTPVLTPTGFKPIECVSVEDSVWDGTDWVSHSGVTFSGLKDVLELDGLWMTFDHPVLTDKGWVEAWRLQSSTLSLNEAISTETGKFSLNQRSFESLQRAEENVGRNSVDAKTYRQVKPKTSMSKVSSMVRPLAVRQLASVIVTSTDTPRLSQTDRYAKNGSTGSQPLCRDATRKVAQFMSIMDFVESKCTRNCTTELNSFDISRRSKTGMLPGLNLTDSTTMVITPRVTSVCQRGQRIIATKRTIVTSSTPTRKCQLTNSGVDMRHVIAPGVLWREKSMKERQAIRSLLIKNGAKVRTNVATYDVTNAGPNHCFQAGSYIVHNSAVLGLGFCMSAFGYAQVLLRVCSDPLSKVTEEKLKQMVLDLKWPAPSDPAKKLIIDKTGCSGVIAMAAWNIHRLFNEAHPEFGMTATWLVRCITEVATVGQGKTDDPNPFGRFIAAEKLLRRMAQAESAPDPKKIRLIIDDDYNARTPSVRVHCGPWPSTVCWREPLVRTNKLVNEGKPRLTILKANGMDKSFTKQLAIENVTQAAARNALCYGLLQLEERYNQRDILHVHDEVLLIVDRNREAVLAAKQQLIDVFGPKANHPLDWSILIKPDEISVTRSLWEEEDDIIHVFDKEKQLWKGGDRWGRIQRGDANMFDNLP